MASYYRLNSVGWGSAYINLGSSVISLAGAVLARLSNGV